MNKKIHPIFQKQQEMNVVVECSNGQRYTRRDVPFRVDDNLVIYLRYTGGRSSIVTTRLCIYSDIYDKKYQLLKELK